MKADEETRKETGLTCSHLNYMFACFLTPDCSTDKTPLMNFTLPITSRTTIGREAAMAFCESVEQCVGKAYI